MNQAVIDKIAEAVLYEGYNLYPYRPSVKNRCRWMFGGLYPPSYSETSHGTEACMMQVQCLVQVEKDSTLEIKVRYLHLMQRTIGVLPAVCDELPAEKEPDYEAVDSLQLDGTHYQSWQEAVEREVLLGPFSLASLHRGVQAKAFTAPASHSLDPLRNGEGKIAAVAVRDQQSLEGEVEASAELVENSVYRITVRICNRAALENARKKCTRDEALIRSLVAVHAILIVREGKFISLTDPPEAMIEAAASCQNLGAWPVLVGSPGEQDAMLASPIILYDYPQIAPESPGDLFDGTEIDELLSLRIMTLTDAEKAQARSMDDRTRRLIERTESLAREQLAGLHGAVRSLEAAGEEMPQGIWDPYAQPSTVKSIRVDDVNLRPGDRVRLKPSLGGDIFDLALSGKTATIESIEQDYEDQFHVAVTLDDDPGRDLGRERQPGHRFFFKPEEIAPL